MIRILIADAHNRLRRYQREISQLRNLCLNGIGETLTQNLEKAIALKVNRTKQVVKEKLSAKLARITPSTETDDSEAWIRNLSNRTLSVHEKAVLIKGLNFNYKDANQIDFLAALESAMKSNNLPLERMEEIRQNIVPAMNRRSKVNMFSKSELQALKNLKNDKNIIILPADKGRMTVIMNRTDYFTKAEQLVKDAATYQEVKEDPTRRLENQVNKTLKKIEQEGQISKYEYDKMKSGDSNIPRFYCLPKVHKEGVPFRPIVALPGSPNYRLSKELWRRLRYLVENSEYSIKSAQQFLARVQQINVDADEVMVSFDVTSLFTSIDTTLAKQAMNSLLERNEAGGATNQISHANIMLLLDLCLTNYFRFNGKIYKQIQGTPMGSPISGLIAEAVMQRLEEIALPIIQPKLWVRYVDDTFVIIKRQNLDETHRIIDNIFTGIKFTREEESNCQLPFLDVLVRRLPTGKLETSVYRKPTNTDQILNFRSNHPISHKRSCLQTLFKRAWTHCSTPELRKEEQRHLFAIFQRNGYPKNFIFRNMKSGSTNGATSIVSRVTIPYIRDVSEAAARLLLPLGVLVAHKPVATLRNTLSKVKDKRSTGDSSNVIYKIPCQDCNKYYVGQTGRKLNTRISEHRQAIKRHDQASLVSAHMDEQGHHFNLDGATILGRARTRRAREFLEAWYSGMNSINRHVDLEPVYELMRSRSQTGSQSARSH